MIKTSKVNNVGRINIQTKLPKTEVNIFLSLSASTFYKTLTPTTYRSSNVTWPEKQETEKNTKDSKEVVLPLT